MGVGGGAEQELIWEWLGAALGANTQPMNKRDKQSTSHVKKVNLIKLSADVHKRDYKICRQVGDQNLEPVQVFEPQAAVDWALKQLESAQRVVFCYEAGFSGFSLARRLQAQGVEPLVMCPQKLDERCKRVATDKRDARAIASRLDRFLAGNDEALVKVRIPTVSEEDLRAMSRQRDQFLKARKRAEAQGRSLLYFKGLACPNYWWRGTPSQWQETVQKQAWPATVVKLLEAYRRVALALDEEILRLSETIESVASEHLPPSMPALPSGFGRLSLEIVRREVCDWNRFKNRRQVGSFFGLCSTENSSGQRQIRGSITKIGNARGRYALIELTWRALQFQPDYWVVKKFQPRIAKTKTRSVLRKKYVVAMARLIAVDLWRLYTGQTTAAKLGLRVGPGSKVYELKPV
jgi:transposase